VRATRVQGRETQGDDIVLESGAGFGFTNGHTRAKIH
jgi:hypothetical protein